MHLWFTVIKILLLQKCVACGHVAALPPCLTICLGEIKVVLLVLQ